MLAVQRLHMCAYIFNGFKPTRCTFEARTVPCTGAGFGNDGYWMGGNRALSSVRRNDGCKWQTRKPNRRLHCSSERRIKNEWTNALHMHMFPANFTWVCAREWVNVSFFFLPSFRFPRYASKHYISMSSFHSPADVTVVASRHNETHKHLLQWMRRASGWNICLA